jgi:para-aminobenzoate synthetase / 4-amino-4-deoxychorismate lyase
MIRPDAPFVLLDDARAHGAVPARLYTAPREILTIDTAGEIPNLLQELRCANAAGLHVAGYLNYEAGHALNGQVAADNSGSDPVAWFGLFDTYGQIEPDVIASCLPDPAGAWLTKFIPEISRGEYSSAFSAVQNYILAGDIYQANLTFQAAARYAGSPLALYAAIRARASAGYGGAVWTGSRWTLSFSPELFFALKDRRITTKPMKGTAVRLADPIADAIAAQHLREDPKQRAENLMIVDLLRNDISRVCNPGSVKVPELFKIESYPTVHQMISAVQGDLGQDRDACDVLAAIFPCGSITGAPKIRAMQIIDELEHSARGIYCGSIGRIDPGGDAAFNVAIRTFSLCEKTKRVSLGLGSGVVADSIEQDEWAECLAKGEFAKLDGRGFDLIETMRFEPVSGILRLEAHLERLKSSAQALGFECDRHAARNQLHAVTFHLEKPSKIRMMLSQQGAIAIEVSDAPPAPMTPWGVTIVPMAADPDDFRLHHKTSDRAFYDNARIAAQSKAPSQLQCDEILFVDAHGYLTEGSITALFVPRGDQLLTPPLSRGALPCVLRRELLETGKAIEGDIQPKDLVGEFFVGNSLRGLIAARLLD